MIRLHKISLFFVVACLVSSGTAAKTLIAGSVHKSAQIQSSDTLDSNKLLKVNPFRLDIILPSSGVQFYRDGIVFLSNSRSEGKMLESHTSFGKAETYYAPCKDTTLGNHTLFSSSFSWEVPCEAMTFNSDYSIMYYTKLPTNREQEKIFEAKYQVYNNGKHDWTSENKPLSFCSDKSIYTHPALSADGDKIVFASNRGESVGGLDLFISYKEGSDWSSPINLGNLINTPGNELFPFLDQNNNLFFSSDGIKGFGGYDIYICWYNGRGWDKPINLTQRINTPDDDLAFTISRLDEKSAFFTTRTKTGSRSPQLFRVTFQDQYALNKLTNLSNAFKYIAQAGLSSVDTAITVTDIQVVINQPDTAKFITESVKPLTLPKIQQEVAKPPVEEVPAVRDAIIFRVQFSASAKPKGSYKITAGGSTYKTFEYLYNGAHRSCAGEFSTLAPATNLQNILRREGYPDAFIVAFRNNVRLTESILSLARSQEQAGKKPSDETAQPEKLPAAIHEPVKPTVEEVSATSDAVIYRVQFLASSKPKGSYEITVGGSTFKTYEYLYNGAYRSCAGEFATLAPAVRLQNLLKREGHPDAFVVAFKNNVRQTDPALFK